jgi:hypothetical protein
MRLIDRAVDIGDVVNERSVWSTRRPAPARPRPTAATAARTASIRLADHWPFDT